MFNLLIVISLLLALPLVGATRFADPTIAKAFDLFVPIACSTPEFFRVRIGTGFPVAKDRVMTAKHVNCKDGVLEVSDDKGRTWQEIPDSDQSPVKDMDAQVLRVAGAAFENVATFRQGIIGERVAGYGIAFDETATEGYVMQSRETFLSASNIAIGGMSGSALVAKDGKVVGMTIIARATIVGSDTPSAWVSIAIPGPALDRIVKGGRS